MTTTAPHPVSIKIESDIEARVKRLADARHSTPHRLMQEAISQYVEREEKRESFHQAGLDAWQEYQDTGLHASADDVEAWLESWGTDHELPPPACRK